MNSNEDDDDLSDEINDSGLLPCESHSISQPSSELNLLSSFIGKMEKKNYYFRELTQTKCEYTPEEAKQYIDNLKAFYTNPSPSSFGGNAESFPLINITEILNETEIRRTRFLNILLVGEKQSGKSTFLTYIITKLQKETKFKYTFFPSDSPTTKKIKIVYNDNIQSHINLIEYNGFNTKSKTEHIDYIESIINDINNRNTIYHDKVIFDRKLCLDERIHLVLFFMKDHCQNYNENTLTAIKKLSKIVNIVPIISKKGKTSKDNEDIDDSINRNKLLLRDYLTINSIYFLDITKEYIKRTNKDKDDDMIDLSPPFIFSQESSKGSHSKTNLKNAGGDFSKVYYLIFHFYPFSIYKNQYYTKYKKKKIEENMRQNNLIIQKNIMYPITAMAGVASLVYFLSMKKFMDK